MIIFDNNIGNVVGKSSHEVQVNKKINSNVGIGTTSPSKKLEINGTSQGAFTFDPDVSPLVMNTTGTTNVTITSSGGSVIIQLG